MREVSDPGDPPPSRFPFLAPFTHERGRDLPTSLRRCRSGITPFRSWATDAVASRCHLPALPVRVRVAARILTGITDIKLDPVSVCSANHCGESARRLIVASLARQAIETAALWSESGGLTSGREAMSEIRTGNRPVNRLRSTRPTLDHVAVFGAEDTSIAPSKLGEGG
jgi:hypothetical protein